MGNSTERPGSIGPAVRDADTGPHGSGRIAVLQLPYALPPKTRLEYAGRPEPTHMTVQSLLNSFSIASIHVSLFASKRLAAASGTRIASAASRWRRAFS